MLLACSSLTACCMHTQTCMHGAVCSCSCRMGRTMLNRAWKQSSCQLAVKIEAIMQCLPAGSPVQQHSFAPLPSMSCHTPLPIMTHFPGSTPARRAAIRSACPRPSESATSTSDSLSLATAAADMAAATHSQTHAPDALGSPPDPFVTLYAPARQRSVYRPRRTVHTQRLQTATGSCL